jgi:hypothetical protein
MALLVTLRIISISPVHESGFRAREAIRELARTLVAHNRNDWTVAPLSEENFAVFNGTS